MFEFLALFALATHSSLVEGEQLRLQRVSHLPMTKVGNVGDEVCAQICSWWSCTTYYCPGDTICCTPGSPSSRCCAADHPLCVAEGCCPEGYPKVCGEYCCVSDSFCCGDNCCESEDTCCNSENCCDETEPCCKEGETPTCCDKESMACCNGGIGCGPICPSPFDAVGCGIDSEDADQQQLMAFDCPDPTTTNWQLYRVMRTNEDCSSGLLAKNPLDTTTTVNNHVECGSQPQYTSQYISFTSSLEVARFWQAKKPWLNLKIANIKPGTIPSTCVRYDLTSAAKRDQYLDTLKAKNYARVSCEVVLSCGTTPVPCEELTNLDETIEHGEL